MVRVNGAQCPSEGVGARRVLAQSLQGAIAKVLER
jgi:hypothetical protein